MAVTPGKGRLLELHGDHRSVCLQTPQFVTMRQAAVGLRCLPPWRDGVPWSRAEIERACYQRLLDPAILWDNPCQTPTQIGAALATLLWYATVQIDLGIEDYSEMVEVPTEPEIYPLLRHWGTCWSVNNDAFQTEVAQLLMGRGDPSWLFNWLGTSRPQRKGGMTRLLWLGNVDPPPGLPRLPAGIQPGHRELGDEDCAKIGRGLLMDIPDEASGVTPEMYEHFGERVAHHIDTVLGAQVEDYGQPLSDHDREAQGDLYEEEFAIQEAYVHPDSLRLGTLLKIVVVLMMVALAGFWALPAKADHCPPVTPGYGCGVTIFAPGASEFAALFVQGPHGETMYSTVVWPETIPLQDCGGTPCFDVINQLGLEVEAMAFAQRLRMIVTSPSGIQRVDHVTAWGPGNPCYCEVVIVTDDGTGAKVELKDVVR